MFRCARDRRANSLHMMLAVVALLLLSASSAAAGSPIVHQVSAGGPDACIAWGVSDHPGCDGNYSFQAKLYADGSVAGQFSDRFATGDGIHGVIDCLLVEGNQAWLSGVITQGIWEGESLVGQPFSTRVVDNGRSAKDPADQIAFTNIGEGWFVPCTAKPGDEQQHELYDVPQGQVTVK